MYSSELKNSKQVLRPKKIVALPLFPPPDFFFTNLAPWKYFHVFVKINSLFDADRLSATFSHVFSILSALIAFNELSSLYFMYFDHLKAQYC